MKVFLVNAVVDVEGEGIKRLSAVVTAEDEGEATERAGLVFREVIGPARFTVRYGWCVEWDARWLARLVEVLRESEAELLGPWERYLEGR